MVMIGGLGPTGAGVRVTTVTGFSAFFAAAQEAVGRIGPPLPEAVAEPQTRVRVEAAMGAVRRLRSAIDETVGAALGAPAGFNALDGD